MRILRTADVCGGGGEKHCPAAPVLVVELLQRMGPDPTRWGACPAHLYALLAEVDGQGVKINWLGPR